MGPPDQHGSTRQLGAGAFQLRYSVDNLSGSCGDIVRGKYVGQALEPERTDLGQHGALVWHRLPHHHVERAHPVARHDQKMLVVYLIDLAHLSPAKQRERQTALHQRRLRPHTTTSVASASAASGRARASSGCRYSSTNLRYLLRCPAGVVHRVQLGLKRSGGDTPEGWIGREPCQQIVRLSPAHGLRHGQAVPPDHLVQCLTVASRAHTLHQPAFSRHERHLVRHMPPDHVFANLEPRCDVGGQNQNRVSGQEALREG